MRLFLLFLALCFCVSSIEAKQRQVPVKVLRTDTVVVPDTIVCVDTLKTIQTWQDTSLLLKIDTTSIGRAPRVTKSRVIKDEVKSEKIEVKKNEVKTESTKIEATKSETKK